MTKHTIVAISGKMGSGKTTLAKSLVKKYSGIHMKFATPLYEMQSAVLGVLHKYGMQTEMKYGDLLQYLGTEFGRKKFGDNIWADLTKNSIFSTIESLNKWRDKAFIVVDDARFDNELDMFLDMAANEGTELRVLTVRLEASESSRKSRADSWRENTSHPSEIGLDHRLGDFDLVISTDSSDCSEEDTFNKVVSALEKM